MERHIDGKVGGEKLLRQFRRRQSRVDIGQDAAPAAILEVANERAERAAVEADRPRIIERGERFCRKCEAMRSHRARKAGRAPAAAPLAVSAAGRAARGKDDGRYGVRQGGEPCRAPHESSGLSPPAPASLSASNV